MFTVLGLFLKIIFGENIFLNYCLVYDNFLKILKITFSYYICGKKKQIINEAIAPGIF